RCASSSRRLSTIRTSAARPAIRATGAPSKMRLLWALACAILLANCHTDSPGMESTDDLAAAAPDFAGFRSDCGHPGDTGNSLGVGQFCVHESDCENKTKANLCTQLGDPDNYFCTFPCKAMGPADQCGENARCA